MTGRATNTEAWPYARASIYDDHESSKFEEDVPQTLDDSQPVTYTTQLKTFKTNLFQKGCRMLTNCVQYFYKRPLKFVIVGTFYGLCIANREHFVHESRTNVISHLEHLTPKHKVTIPAPSLNFLWYERSCATAVAIFDRFIYSFSKYYLESNEEIQELLECYKVTDGVDDTLHERYVNRMDKEGDGSTPGLIELCVTTIVKLPAVFVPTIMKIKDNVVVKGHRKDRYFYELMDVSLKYL